MEIRVKSDKHELDCLHAKLKNDLSKVKDDLKKYSL